MKPLFALLLLLLHFPSNNAAQADIIDDLSVQFKTGNSKEIAKSFDSIYRIDHIDEEDVYSKAQAEQILKDFFVKNPPVKSRLSINLIQSKLSFWRNYSKYCKEP